MNSRESFESLRRFTLARIPFISFMTTERSRALEVMKKVSEDLMLPFFVHTMSKGTCDISTNRVLNDDKSIMGALDFISEQVKVKQNLTFVLTEVSDIESDSLTARYFYDVVMLAEENGASIIIITNNSVWNQLQRLGMSIQLDLPDEEEMHQIICENIEPYQRDITIDWTANDFREAAAILTGISKVEAQNVIASLIANKSIKQSDLIELKQVKNRLFSDISGLEKIEIDSNTLTVGGLDGLRSWLDEKKILQNPEKRDLLKSRGLQPPRGILLVGVPGCGKSLSAKTIAASWQLPLYRLDFATVQGQYVGQSEQQLKEAFLTAEHVSPCILWIDEIEKGLSGAGSDSSGVTNRMVGQFLFWMQECRKMVFVVATANDVSKLPSELLRRGRFDELFFVDLPTEEERLEINKLYFKKYLNYEPTEEAMNKIVQLTEGFTGADIESSIRDIAYNFLANDISEVNFDYVIQSLSQVVPLSKTSPERIDAIREWGKERAVPASGRKIEGFKKEPLSVRRVIV